MFKLPEDLIELGIKRMEGFPVEGFVKGKGPKKPVLMLIGEAPGENEAIEGVPFIGRAGKVLNNSIASIGLTREDVYITSAVRSRPYVWRDKKAKNGVVSKKKYNRAPSQKEIVAHAPILDYELKNIAPTVIVTLGNVGLQRLLGKEAKVSMLHGQILNRRVQHLQSLESTEYIWSEESYVIIPTYHPASVFYRPSNRDFLEEDWRKIGEYITTQKNKTFFS